MRHTPPPFLGTRGLLAATLGLAAACGKGGDDPPLPYDDLVHACVRATACRAKAYPRVSNCIGAYYDLTRSFGFGPIYDGIYKCINGARVCEDVFACFGTSQATGSCDSSFKARCDGDRAVSCDLLDRRVYVADCALAALGCRVKDGESFEASCTPGACDASYGRRCDGNRMLSCSKGVIVVESCGAQGLVCRADAGSAACVGEQEQSCDPVKFRTGCEAETAVSCVGARVHREACGSRVLGRSCREGVCGNSGTSCNDDFDRCTGDALETCIDGNWVTVPCASLGLGACRPGQNGAACAPPPGS